MLEDQPPPSDIVTCQSGPYGNGYGSNPWSDESVWRAHGRITAVRQWKAPVTGSGDFLCG